ncbi:MAG: glutamate--tRNA ligase [Firmicutes bacterium]|nr:glutamate--tRNA ligase [Bacillota bacterium]
MKKNNTDKNPEKTLTPPPFSEKTLKDLAELLFPNAGVPPSLPAKRIAFRIAPSPTGSLHIGSLAMAFVNRLLADAHKGVFFLRIEDTDKKREVEGGTENLMRGFDQFGIKFDEFAGKQSERTEIYHAFAKQLVGQGHAYPCFCTPEDLEKSREEQIAKKETPGYKHEYAVCRGLGLDDTKQKLSSGMKWCLRFMSDVTQARVSWQDLIRGEMSLPYQENNFVILKKDGIPPYNFAHVVDDTMMSTSHVVRGEEWLPSTAEHIQLHRALFSDEPSWHYAHFPVTCVQENGNKRKISKRKDVFAATDWFIAQGYPVASIKEYILTLFNTNYEMWRIANPTNPYTEFDFKFENIGTNSPLFDLQKLDYLSREVISRMTKSEIRELVTEFGITDDKILLALEIDRETQKPRKDIAKWSEVPEMFDYLVTAPKTGKNPIVKVYLDNYKTFSIREEWFAWVKSLCIEIKVKDLTQAVRVSITGRESTPDLWEIQNILGEDEVKTRLRRCL